MQPVANLAAAEVKDKQSKCDITVADILGPLLEKESGTSAEVVDGSESGTSAEVVDDSDRARDANFSLLSYSFSLVGLSSQTSRNVQLCQGWDIAGRAV